MSGSIPLVKEQKKEKEWGPISKFALVKEQKSKAEKPTGCMIMGDPKIATYCEQLRLRMKREHTYESRFFTQKPSIFSSNNSTEKWLSESLQLPHPVS